MNDDWLLQMLNLAARLLLIFTGLILAAALNAWFGWDDSWLKVLVAFAVGTSVMTLCVLLKVP